MLHMSGTDLSYLLHNFSAYVCIYYYVVQYLCLCHLHDVYMFRMSTLPEMNLESWTADMVFTQSVSNNGWCARICAPYARQQQCVVKIRHRVIDLGLYNLCKFLWLNTHLHLLGSLNQLGG